jgi:dTDP-4-amino-4,6-dideoxygalactose transaminase
MDQSAIPALDLKAHHAPIKDEIYAAMRQVVESNAFILGPDVDALETEVATYCGAKNCLGVSSGSDALLLALMGLDVKPGDEIITTPFTFFATAGAIARVGAVPVFVDIEPKSFNIDPAKIAAKITNRTRGLMPVHLYGQCAEMDPILDIARKHNLFVIEDAAQAIGAEYKGKRAGSMGTVGCFSFFPSKNLGAFGDGGAVTTNDADLAEKMRVLRVHGSKPKYYHHVVGGNFRLDTLQAAVLRVKLKHLDQWSAQRQQVARKYRDLITSRSLEGNGVECPRVVQSRHIFNQFVIRATRRDELQQHLNKQKIGNAIYYPVPMHLQKCFAYLNHREGDFPESEAAARATLALPMFPELTEKQQKRVVDVVAEFYAAAGQQYGKRAA